MITDWATVAEPAITKTFVNPCYASDIQILSAGKGIGMVTPDGTKLYRVYLDFDGAVDSELINLFTAVPLTTPPPVTGPFPVFGQVTGDLLILSAGAGILFPGGLPSSSPRQFFRMRLDNDGAPGTEPAVMNYWMKIPENSIPSALDAQGNWVFTQDIVMVSPGTGIVMLKRGLTSTRRLRIDTDGALLTE